MAVIEFQRGSEVDYGISGDSDSRVFTYYAKVDDIVATPDQDDLVLDFAAINTPGTYDGLRRGTIGIEQVLPDVYRVQVNYSANQADTPEREQDPTTGSYEIAFSQSVIRTKRLFSLETVAAFGTNANVDDYDRAIGVQPGGQINGAEGFDSVGRRVVEFTIPNSILTPAYENTVEDLVGTVWQPTAPATLFLNRVEGEVMFLGVRGRVRLNETFSKLAFEFEVRKRLVFPVNGRTDIAGITIPNGTIINPFDVVWPRYEESNNVAGDGPGEEAVAVYIERIAEWGDFELLNIPGAVT